MSKLLIIAIVWLAIAGFAALELWPFHPRGFGGWILFAVLAPPVFLLAQAVSEWGWSTRFGRFVSDHPSRLARISLGVVVIGAGAALLGFVWIAIAHVNGGAGV